ncbi:MAG TPA: protein YgfX [Rhodocyclaceae bacterium]|nr:protein YgfX [Rhodocyclaceae bacterium]
MSATGSSPIRCAIRPSVFLTAFLFVGHMAALIGLLPLELAAPLKLGLALLLGASAFHSVYRVWHPFVAGLVAGSDGRLSLEWKGQEPQVVEVSEQTLVLPWLIVLRFRLVGDRLAKGLVLPVDGVSPRDAHRLLRRWLRWRMTAKP